MLRLLRLLWRFVRRFPQTSLLILLIGINAGFAFVFWPLYAGQIWWPSALMGALCWFLAHLTFKAEYLKYMRALLAAWKDEHPNHSVTSAVVTVEGEEIDLIAPTESSEESTDDYRS